MDNGLRSDNRTPLVALGQYWNLVPIFVEDSGVLHMVISVVGRISTSEETTLGPNDSH
jgi:hypothetical protein